MRFVMTRTHGLSLSFCLLLLSLPAIAFGQITYNDFSDVTGLALNGSAAQATNGSGQKVLRLTPDGTMHVSGSAWSIVTPSAPTQQSVGNGFTTIFQFQVTHAGSPADGMAFVIQNSSGSGFGTAARGGSGGAIGYGAPDPGDNGVAIPNSLAIEFDTFQNAWDPDSNHIAVQSCGPDPNTQNHNANCPSGAPSNLGLAPSSGLGGVLLSDGAVHTAVIDYDGNTNTLYVFLDNLGAPILTINVNLSTLLTLNNGDAWVGFTGGSGAQTENHDVLSWTFTPATTQTSITQTLTTGGGTATTNYVFGSYNHKLQYTNADPDVVTVTAIPISQSDFAPRLANTPYQSDQCAIYEGTGGLCVEFEVTCTDNVGTDCSNLPYDLFNNFNTQDTVVGPCMLKAPINTSSWTNIIEDFTQTRNDPGSHGSTKGFSDFILVQGPSGSSCTLPPTVSSPLNNGVFSIGPVQILFSCTPDPTAPNVTATCNTGVVNGPGVSNLTVNNGDYVSFTGSGAATLSVAATDSVLNTSTGNFNFTIGQAPTFLSGNAATFTAGTFGSFSVVTSGFPAATITELGALPSGVTLVNNGNGMATLGGTPALGSGGIFSLTLTAHNGINPDGLQTFTLTVNQAPGITSANNVTFSAGVSGSFTVTSTGFPTAALTESGTLPGGVTFVDNHNGTATLSGTASSSGTFPLIFTATNGVGSSATQGFTLTVNGAKATVSPTSINFGNVSQFKIVSSKVTLTNTGNSTLKNIKVSLTLGSGADWDDFFFLSLCGSSLSPGKNCTIYVYYFADDLGTAQASLNVASSDPSSPAVVSLTGTGVKH
jgi:hypothetical protein